MQTTVTGEGKKALFQQQPFYFRAKKASSQMKGGLGKKSAKKLKEGSERVESRLISK